MNNKKLSAILTAITIVTLIGSMFLTSVTVSAATTYTQSYATTSGVLATDNYVLFPYQKKNLTIGFSKYGEMIDYNTKTGLSYGGYDGFGPDAGVVEWQWVEGWILNITYVEGGYYKNVWAMATYSDYASGGVGGDWNEDVTVGSLSLTVRGGRKTSGGAVTDPIQVLYDGPRKFVALLKTTIYADSTHGTPLVSVTFTIEFNKVKKQVIIFKDVKRIDVGKNIWDMQIEFGDRGEWDLGSSVSGAAPKSYAHFFENETTVYDGEYQPWYEGAPTPYEGTYDVCQIISDDQDFVGWAAFWPKPIISWVGATQVSANRDFILTSTSTKTEIHTLTTSTQNFTLIMDPVAYPQNSSVTNNVTWIEDPMVFVNDHVRIINGTNPAESVTYYRDSNMVSFPAGYIPDVGDVVKIVYKHVTKQIDMLSEPNSPFVIGEWAFRMTEAGQIFRGVTIYGITDLNDGSDSSPALDSEVVYHLDETFNPYDLIDAVHKDTRRWVYLVTSLPSPTLSVVLPNAPMIFDPLPVWDEYCTFAERVLVNGVLRVPTRAGGSGYTLSVNSATGVGTITFPSALPAGTHLKILYSTMPQWFDADSISFTEVTNTTTTISPLPTLTANVVNSAYAPVDPIGVNMSFNFDVDVEVEMTGAANFTETVTMNWYDWIEDFKVLSDPNTVDDDTDHYTMEFENMTIMGTNITATITGGIVGWNITANNEATVIDGLLSALSLEIVGTAYEAGESSWFNITITPTVAYEYAAHQEGAYEWMVVGKDAATIDSAGAAYVTQAFDSLKQIHVQMTGMDIKDTEYGEYAPYVMGYGSSGVKADYRDSLGRAYLADDWCTTWPVSSSNMLFAGGARANLGTEYFNDFTSAFYAMGEYVTNDTGHANSLMALSCWDRNYYMSNDTYGYAAVSVYKDLNGTIGFLIWGINGQDTYFATKWFWNYPAGITTEIGTTAYSGIQYLQAMNEGITDIVLRIYYPPADPIHPTVSVIEKLGTVSEKPQHDCPAPDLT